MTVAPILSRIFVSTAAVITLSVTLQSPGNAFDRIEPQELKALSKCEDCNLPYVKLRDFDLGEVVDTELNNTMQTLFTHSHINQLAQKNSKVQTQIKQNVDDLRAIFLRLLKNPADLQLNIKYAELAEKRGKIDAALTTYERLALLDPHNKDWKSNIERLRDLTRPPETSIAAILGGRIDSNGPLNADKVGNRAEYNGSIVLSLDHKRSLGGHKYQATGQFYGDYNLKAEESDLLLATLQFGPLVKISTSWKLRPALLFERSATDRRNRNSLSYSAGTLFNFENLDDGPIRTVDISLYHLGFDNETPGKDSVVFTSSSGLLYQGLKESDQLRLTPNVTFNGARGGGGSDGFRDLYYQIGLDIEYGMEISENVLIEPIMSYFYRDYIDYEPGGNTKRDDHNFNIGLQATVINIIPDVAVLATYSFERNKSNLSDETYKNHSIGLNFIKSF